MRPGQTMLSFLLMSGCSDYGLEDQSEQTSPAPELSLSAHALDFGLQGNGDQASKVLWLENTGTSALALQHLSIAGSPAFSMYMPEKVDALLPNESAAVVVHYAPINTDEEADLVIVTNDPRQHEVLVPLTGSGAYPELSVSENPLVLATASPGDITTGLLTITNTGEAPLHIENLVVNGSAFDLVEYPLLPLELQPERSRTLEVEFSANHAGTYDGQLWFEDNTVGGLSSGGLLGASAVPVALCDASQGTVAPIHGSVDWLGDESFDAAGGELVEYRWKLLDQPAGSSAALNGGTGNANRYNFTPDMAGTYTAQLIVINEEGVSSEPCTTSINAVPDQNLWIEMFWTHEEDDMDLHLLRPGGEIGTDNDCFYDNCVSGGLDWGELGRATDDPSLDIDDIHGTGPENINIPVPEDGTFTVIVHDYQFSTPNYTGANDVTVNVFLGGQLAWTGTRSISDENTYTRFVRVSWPDGTITEVQ